MTPCKSLYALCLELCVPRIENYSKGLPDDSYDNCKWIENLAGPVAEDLLNYAFRLANNPNKFIRKIWKREWKIFFTSKVTSALLAWDSDLINYIGSRCKNLQKCEVVSVENFEADLILKLPKSVKILDFDGELVSRGRLTKPLLFHEEEVPEGWLPQTEGILKALRILRTPPPEYLSATGTSDILDIHLGTVKATKSDLQVILRSCPRLHLLRHYQMVTALYELHSESWKKKSPLPRYSLKNLDVDFSHLVRCRMSPEWVLAPDALQLAVVLCPSATSVRVRFDSSTPHDVLAPLTGLSQINEFSAVCVSSGERTLLDFGDMVPLFERFGENCLTYLELKVIEQVEIHVIIELCTKLEMLILSGCGYITPPTCSRFACQKYERGSFKKLRCLFYADGDDFGWDHGVPDCFWRASLCPSGCSRGVRLQGLFLEYPRMSPSLTKEIFHRNGNKSSVILPFPELQVLSVCRFAEITTQDIASICGLSRSSPSSSSPSQTLKYVRLSDCEKITESDEKTLKRWLKQCKQIKIKIDVDR